jgi:enhancing lycopene biosynthesis protein 2
MVCEHGASVPGDQIGRGGLGRTVAEPIRFRIARADPKGRRVMVRVAVILSGCGVFDGSEIHEAVSVLLHLSEAGAEVRCFAPDIRQAHVVDHLAGKPVDGESRNVLAESARITRGEISDLPELRADDFDALILPGGFGAAKNLCSFAFDGAGCTVHPEVERVVREFHGSEKPIGMCCIAPVIAARVLGKASGGPGCVVTIGNDDQTAGAIEAMGAEHAERPVTEACLDADNRLVTAPAYMYGEAKIHEVSRGIGEMVRQTLDLAGAARPSGV